MFIKIAIPDNSSLKLIKFLKVSHAENITVGNKRGHYAKVIKYSLYPL